MKKSVRRMQIVFMGSSVVACPSLVALSSEGVDHIAGVITQPDRPSGRGQKVVRSPLKECVPAGMNVHTPEDINADASIELLRSLKPDVIVIVSFGQILSAAILAIPPLGCVNLHPSLLPKYRGAAPIQWAIANGDKITGVTTMFINERMDAGDIILQREVPIADTDTGGLLQLKLANEGAVLLVETMKLVRSGNIQRRPQSQKDVTFARILKKADGRIDWTMSASRIHNRVRAFNPWPGSFCEAPTGSGRLLKVLETSVEDSAECRPGWVVEWSGTGPLVQTGEKALRLVMVQPENKKAMSGQSYLCGHPQLEQFG